MAYDHSNLLAVFKTFVQIVGKALRGSADGIDVHAVGTNSHDAAKSACAELQVLIEGFYQLCFIGIIQHSSHFCLSLGIIGRSKPFLGFGSHFLNQSFIFHSNYIIN